MRTLLRLVIFSSLLAGTYSESSEEKSAEDYLNKCMSLIGSYSHAEPKKEPTLECPQYRDNACCQPGATLYFQDEEQWMNITDYNHCAVQSGKPKLNQTCHDRYFDELCFFLCSPDTGPWIDVATHDEPVDDRIVRVPICQSVCDDWYDACKEEYTCTNNWYIGFNSTGPGIHRCMDDSQCKTYQETWGGATAFCQGIWDNSFSVVPDSEPCMKFAQDQTSQNADVAKHYAKELVGSASSPWQWIVPCCVTMVTLVAVVCTFR